MKKPYFVMLKPQAGTCLLPLLEPDGRLAMFDTFSDAKDAGVKTPFGAAFGLIVFDTEFDGTDC